MITWQVALAALGSVMVLLYGLLRRIAGLKSDLDENKLKSLVSLVDANTKAQDIDTQKKEVDYDTWRKAHGYLFDHDDSDGSRSDR